MKKIFFILLLFLELIAKANVREVNHMIYRQMFIDHNGDTCIFVPKYSDRSDYHVKVNGQTVDLYHSSCPDYPEARYKLIGDTSLIIYFSLKDYRDAILSGDSISFANKIIEKQKRGIKYKSFLPYIVRNDLRPYVLVDDNNSIIQLKSKWNLWERPSLFLIIFMIIIILYWLSLMVITVNYSIRGRAKSYELENYNISRICFIAVGSIFLIVEFFTLLEYNGPLIILLPQALLLAIPESLFQSYIKNKEGFK